MKKLLTNLFGSILLPYFISEGEDAFEKVLQEFHDKDATLYAGLINAGYPFIDVYLEDFAAQSKTKYDDQAVAALKAVIERSAAANGITLQNLDEGQAGD